MSNTFRNVTSNQFQELSQLPVEGSFQMLNLLKFKKKIEENGLTGEEGYAKYLEVAMPFIQSAQAKLVYQGKAILGVIGPEQTIEWDKVLIVEYPSKENFIKMITTEGYPAHLRSQALEDSRLVLCSSI